MPLSQKHSSGKAVIVATSDLHGRLEGLQEVCRNRNADILIIAGDIQPAEIQYHCNDVACGIWFRNKFFSLVKKLGCDVVAIPGNHDFWLRSLIEGNLGTEEEVRTRYRIPSNFHLLCDQEIEIKGLRIYGTPWVPRISGHWCWECADAQSEQERFAVIPDGIDILISHTPPRLQGCNLDVSLDRDPRATRHFGSDALTSIIEEKTPSVVFCGHIHSGEHKCFRICRDKRPSYLYNVSRLNEQYYIGYGFTVLEIREKTIAEICYGEKISA